jgi:hypothetical protein
MSEPSNTFTTTATPVPGGVSGGGQGASASGAGPAGGSRPVAGPPKTIRMGRFKIISKLGKGGMGTVYRAVDEKLQRHVALKVIAKDKPGQTTKFTEAFVREARSVAQLDHPNIVRVFEIGETRQHTFIAMELLEGGDLWQLFKAAGRLEPGRAALIGAEAAEALAYAHTQGVVHRDIKPANLMLARNGRCKITDFGLCKFEDPNDLFKLPEMVGTPMYLAPEVIRQQPAEPASDVYSLAMTLWIVLAGMSPFEGFTRKALYEAKLAAPMPGLRRHRPDVAVKLAEAIDQALDRDPGKRPGMEQFGRLLRLHVSGDVSSVAAPLARQDAPGSTAAGLAIDLNLDLGGSAGPGPGETAVSGVSLGVSRFSNVVSVVSPTASRVLTAAGPSSRKRWVIGAAAAGVVALSALGWFVVGSVMTPPKLTTLRVNHSLWLRPLEATDLLAVAAPLRMRDPNPICVRGTVSVIEEVGGGYVIRFKGSQLTAEFKGEVAPQMQRAFGSEAGRQLVGKAIMVNGAVSGTASLPVIQIQDVDQVKVVPPPPVIAPRSSIQTQQGKP